MIRLAAQNKEETLVAFNVKLLRDDAVFFYVRCAVFYCDLEEIMAERGVEVDQQMRQRPRKPVDPDNDQRIAVLDAFERTREHKTRTIAA